MLSLIYINEGVALTAVFEFIGQNQILLLFLLVGLGMALGRVHVKGVSLGAAAVLFVAIGVSVWANTYGVEVKLDHMIGILGLALFAFAIGVNSGPNFFNSLKSSLGPILSMLVLFGVVGAAAYVIGVKAMGLDVATMAGSFAGAVTNTPALSAAGEASGQADVATVGYSITYLFGVLGMLLAANAALAYSTTDRDKPSPIANRTVRVERQDNPRVEDIEAEYGGKVQFSRLRRGEKGPISRPKPSDSLHDGDLVTIVGPAQLLGPVIRELGHGSTHSLLEDRRYLDFRRITVSDPSVAGKAIGDLNFEDKFSATISRVRRGDVDMVGTPDLVLQEGDRVRVVAPRSKMKDVTKFFGDSTRGLTNINPIALGIGMSLGILIGELPIPVPGGSTFAIGSAAGTLIMGLIFGRIGRVGPIITALPHTTCMVLSEFGLLVFLAQAGTNAGGQIAKAFVDGQWIKILGLGIILTTLMALGLYVIMRYLWKMGGTQLSGLMGGAQTQPAVLAFANSQTNADPRVALGYSMVYPWAMVGKILVAQVLGGL